MKKEIEFRIYAYYVYANFKLVERLVTEFPWLVPHQEEDSCIIYFEVPSSLRSEVERFIPKSRVKYVCSYQHSIVYED